MKKILLTVITVASCLFFLNPAYAQTTISTNHINNNGNGSITFCVQNTNAFDVIITAVSVHLGTTANNNIQLLYNTVPYNDLAAPWSFGTVGAGQNGWILAGTNTISNSNTANGVVPVLTGLNLLIPAGATYQLGLSATTMQYMTLVNGGGANMNTFSGGGVNLKTGDGISWGGVVYPATPANYPRGFIGSITFVPACNSAPTAGVVSPASNAVCPSANNLLSITGGTASAGQTFQWQSSNDSIVFSDIPGATGSTYISSQTMDTYYRFYTSCSGMTDTSASALVQTNSSSTGTDVITTCDSMTWIDGNTYTSNNNTATATLTNAIGCDSVVTLDLTINYSTTGTDVITTCDSLTWIDGNTYTSDNSTAIYNLTNVMGCDSVVTLNLIINHSTAGTDVITTCDSMIWIDGNTYTADNSTATYALTNVVGCDSVVTLNLIINHSTTGTDVITTCDSIIWMDGNTYTADNNTATYTLTNALGCDSVVTLNLTISHSAGTDVITACDSLTWIDGNIYTADNNTATYTLTNAMGCDSVVTLNLTINHADAGITINGSTITSNDTSATYQWIDCNTMQPVSGETNRSFIASVSGMYAVIVTDGSCSGTSVCTAVSLSGIYERASEKIKVYPNPGNGVFTINLENTVDEAHVFISDMNEKVVLERDYKEVKTINMNTELIQGVYILHIHTKNDESVFRLIVIK
jgi:hypothetical protein